MPDVLREVEEHPLFKRSPNLQSFLKGLLQMDPEYRLCGKDALQHPWLATEVLNAKTDPKLTNIGTFERSKILNLHN